MAWFKSRRSTINDDPIEILKISRISDRLFLVYEDIHPGTPNVMALVIGDEKAALIDTGYGASGDLDQVVRGLTDKPVICLLTHADPDHAGGAALFPEIYLHPADQALLERGAVKVSIRRMIAHGLAGQNKVLARQIGRSIVQANGFSYRHLADSQVIDLGNQRLEVVAFPGHSPGSVCFWNEAENYIVAGDSIANASSAVLFFDKCLPLRDYHRHLVRFHQRFGSRPTIYTGHDLDPLDRRIVPELLALCDEIFAGQTADDTPYLPPFLRFDPQGAGWLERLIKPRILALVAQKELGDSVPLEHKKTGFLATIKYNARKIK